MLKCWQPIVFVCFSAAVDLSKADGVVTACRSGTDGVTTACRSGTDGVTTACRSRTDGAEVLFVLLLLLLCLCLFDSCRSKAGNVQMSHYGCGSRVGGVKMFHDSFRSRADECFMKALDLKLVVLKKFMTAED